MNKEITQGFILGIAIFAVIISLYTFYKLINLKQIFYVVDTDSLVNAYLDKAINKIKTGENPNKLQNELSKELDKIKNEINSLSNDKNIIIKKSVLLNYPNDIDITSKIAEKLNLNLNE